MSNRFNNLTTATVTDAMHTFRSWMGCLLVSAATSAVSAPYGVAFNGATGFMDLYAIDSANGTSSLVSASQIGGWSTDARILQSPHADRVHLWGSAPLGLGNQAQRITTIDIANGQSSTISLDRNYQGVASSANGSLVGIRFNGASSQNELVRINASTGVGTSLLSFAFPGGFWNSGSFTADPMHDLAYAMSGSNLFRFDLAAGTFNSSSLDRAFHAIDVTRDGGLVGLFHNNAASQLEFHSIDPGTFASRFVSASAFSGSGLPTGGFSGSPFSSVSYLSMGTTAYAFDQMGPASTLALDRGFTEVADIAPIPLPASGVLLAFALSSLLLSVRRGPCVPNRPF